MKTVVLILLLWLGHFTVTAQIVNIEDRRITSPDSVRWTGRIDLQFNLVENGKTIISAKTNGRLDYRNDRHHVFFLTQYNLGKIDGADFINDGFLHLRYNYHLKDWLTWETFGQYQVNEKINLNLRGLFGTGPRFQVLKKENARIYLGTLYMFEYDDEFLENGDPLIQRDHRLSSYFSFNLQPTPQITIASTSYFQPVLNDLKDIRFSSQTNVLFKIIKQLHYSTAFSITYDTEPPGSVVNTIYSWTNGLRWFF